MQLQVQKWVFFICFFCGFWFYTLLYFTDSIVLQLLPEFLQVEAFAKLSNAIGKVNVIVAPV